MKCVKRDSWRSSEWENYDKFSSATLAAWAWAATNDPWVEFVGRLVISSSHISPSHCPLTLWFVIMCMPIRFFLVYFINCVMSVSSNSEETKQQFYILFCLWDECGGGRVRQMRGRESEDWIDTAKQIFRDFLYDNSGTHCTNYEWNESTSAPQHSYSCSSSTIKLLNLIVLLWNFFSFIIMKKVFYLQ